MSQPFQSLYRQQFGRIVALTARITGDLSQAEDHAQEAFIKAAKLWGDAEIPGHAVAWLTTTARHSALDALRRDQRFETIRAELPPADGDANIGYGPDVSEAYAGGEVEDDMLRLIFTCAHPALHIESRVALCLAVVCGLRTEEIARAFLVTDATMSQRLWRAKTKIKNAGIAYRSPEPEELEARLKSVLAVIFLIFNEGWLARSGESGLRMTLVDEAIRLGRLLTAVPLKRREPQSIHSEPRSVYSEPQALLSLMILQNARRDARFDHNGAMVLLPDQNRALWYREEIGEGLSLVEGVFKQGGGHARYALMAAIAAVHVQASSAETTDWEEIVTLYGYLMNIDPSPVIALNHAVAVGEAKGAAEGLRLLELLSESKAMRRYHLYHAARAEMLRKCKKPGAALEAIADALNCCPEGVEKDLLRKREAQIQTG